DEVEADTKVAGVDLVAGDESTGRGAAGPATDPDANRLSAGGGRQVDQVAVDPRALLGAEQVNRDHARIGTGEGVVLNGQAGDGRGDCEQLASGRRARVSDERVVGDRVRHSGGGGGVFMHHAQPEDAVGDEGVAGNLVGGTGGGVHKE